MVSALLVTEWIDVPIDFNRLCGHIGHQLVLVQTLNVVTEMVSTGTIFVIAHYTEVALNQHSDLVEP